MKKVRYVISPQVEALVKRDNIPATIINRIRKICSNDVPGVLEQVGPTAHKGEVNTHGGYRHIWIDMRREDVQLFFLRKVYIHDEYEREVNAQKIDKWTERFALAPEELAQADKIFTELTAGPQAPEPLPEEFREYENRPRGFEEMQDCLVFELQEWVKGFVDVPDVDRKEVLAALEDIVMGNISEGTVEHGFLRKRTTSGQVITYRYEGEREVKAVYLLHIGNTTADDVLLERKYDVCTLAALRTKSAKCYPAFIVCDFETWHAVEKDNQANLALSAEELRILQNIEYPFFVSGLAGSGKSTILYYLFAHIYDHKIRQNDSHRLLFLSYSHKLVTNAQNIVRSILMHHQSYGHKDLFEDKDRCRDFEQCFMPFQEFIRQEFLDSDDYDLFSRDKYVDYQAFKDLYASCKLSDAKRLSADIVWSVIRTFIKGRTANGFFTPEDYAGNSLAAKDRTVTQEDYARAYRIWNGWYRKLFDERKAWDDLDLVRYALSKKDDAQIHFHKYSVIFCDEAQDFTKLETDLIIRLSVHSKYDLTTNSGDELIPIAFAGDPNQTVNPTGFRWGSAQEVFTNSFRESLGDFRGFTPNILEMNYRSREGIVKLANTIQLIRHKHLNDDRQQLKLQTAWDCDTQPGQPQSDDSLSYVAFYCLDDHKERIDAALSKSIVITADEGEYAVENLYDDADRNKLFEDTLKSKNALGLPDNLDNSRLYTAITSKGLEFKSTILYRFSSDPAMMLFERLLDGKPSDSDSDLYKLSHFFTKLYIAISRAKQVLFIVDTREAYDRFWRHLVEPDLWNAMLSRLCPDAKIRESLGRISMGIIDDLDHRLSENYNPKEYADGLFNNAICEKSRDTMNRARSAYKEAKAVDKANLCEAYMFMFDHKYKEAGERFISLGRKDDALNCFWAGALWAQFVKTVADIPMRDSNTVTRNTVANFMKNEDATPVAEFLAKWVAAEDDFQDSISAQDNRDVWMSVLAKVRDSIGALKPAVLAPAMLRNIKRLSEFFLWFEDGMAALRASLHYKRAMFVNRDISQDEEEFKREDFEEAIRLWEAIGNTTSKEFYTAKRKLSKTSSEEIVWGHKLGESDRILKKFADPKQIEALALSEEAQGIIFTLLLGSDFGKAMAYPYPTSQEAKWNRLYANNRSEFTRRVVLENFNLEKFYFLADKIKNDTSNYYDNALDSEIVSKIFTLQETDDQGKPMWVYFMTDLKAFDGQRILKREENRTAVLDALDAVITQNKDCEKTLASCFMEMLFDKNYNYGRATKYQKCLNRIVEREVFQKDDFRAGQKKNHYFISYCDLSTQDLDTMKDHVRNFADNYVANNKINSNTAANVKNALIAKEICVPFSAGNIPNFMDLASDYRRLSSDKKMAHLKDWLTMRALVNQLQDDRVLQRASWKSFTKKVREQKSFGIDDVLDNLTKEDAGAFVVAATQNRDESSLDRAQVVARVINSFHLRRENLMPYVQVRDTWIAAFIPEVDSAVKEVLASNRIDEVVLKTLASVWDSMLDHREASEKYDALVKSKRLAQMFSLLGYLKRRALFHYFYLQPSVFTSMQTEYGIHMDKDTLPRAIPVIEAKVADATAAPTQRRTRTENEVLDPVKAAMLIAAKAMKERGDSIEKISKDLPLLSVDDIRNA